MIYWGSGLIDSIMLWCLLYCDWWLFFWILCVLFVVCIGMLLCFFDLILFYWFVMLMWCLLCKCVCCVMMGVVLWYDDFGIWVDVICLCLWFICDGWLVLVGFVCYVCMLLFRMNLIVWMEWKVVCLCCCN